MVFSWAASPVQAVPDAGPVEFISESRTYTGQYAAENRSIAVEIDGVRYQGHYASNTEDEAALQINKPKTGQWGRGFLFAHRAKVLQCQLNSGFPKVSGQCQSADGRQFEIAMPAKPWNFLDLPLNRSALHQVEQLLGRRPVLANPCARIGGQSHQNVQIWR